MKELVTVLCAATSWLCAVLLLRGYFASRSRLLLWSGAGFVAFGVSNVLLFVDLVLLPDVDLSLVRTGLSLAGVCLLLYGLVTERA